MKKYYIHDGQTQQGPFDIDELKGKNISPDTHIWFDTLKEWTTAGQVEELKSLFASSPPPFKSATPLAFHNPLPTDYPSDFDEQPKNKKPLIIGLSILGLAVISAIFYFTNKSSSSRSPEINPLDTSAVYANDKRRLDSLEQLEKDRQTRNQSLSKKNMEYRNNWRKYIEHKPNSNYSISSIGGISDLQIYVTNNTDNILDEVIVTIHYYKSDGGLWQTNELPVYNVQPNSYKSIKVPNTTRGTRFETEISKITSRSLHFCYDNGYEGARGNVYGGGLSGNEADPWFCK
jgi:hypothetical protein